MKAHVFVPARRFPGMCCTEPASHSCHTGDVLTAPTEPVKPLDRERGETCKCGHPDAAHPILVVGHQSACRTCLCQGYRPKPTPPPAAKPLDREAREAIQARAEEAKIGGSESSYLTARHKLIREDIPALLAALDRAEKERDTLKLTELPVGWTAAPSLKWTTLEADLKAALAARGEAEARADARDREWVEAIWPGNANTDLGRLYGTPEKAATLLRESEQLLRGEITAAEARADAAEKALRYIAGEDVAGMEPHLRPSTVARRALAADSSTKEGA